MPKSNTPGPEHLPPQQPKTARQVPFTEDVSRLGAAIEQTPDPFIETDLGGTPTYVNPAGSRTFPDLQSLKATHSLLVDWDNVIATLSQGERHIFREIKINASIYEQKICITPDLNRVQIFVRDVTQSRRSVEQITQQLRESQAFLEISQILAALDDLPTVFQKIAEAAIALIKQTDRAMLHLLDESGKHLNVVAMAGASPQLVSQRLKLTPGSGIAELVLASGQPIRVADALYDPRFASHQSFSMPMRSLVVAPLSLGSKILGTLSVYSYRPDVFSDDDTRLLTILSNQAAVALEKANLIKTERERRQLADALRNIGTVLNTTLDFDAVLDQILLQIRAVVPYDTANLMLVEDGRVRVVRTSGYEQIAPDLDDYVRQIRWEVATVPNLRQMAATHQPIVVPDTESASNWIRTEPTSYVRSWAGAPISAQGQVIAFFLLNKCEANFYQPKHAEYLMAFTGLASLSLQNAKLFGDLRKALTEEKNMRVRLVQQEKLAALGRIIASVAHELNNPLQAIQNALYLVMMEEKLGNQAREDLQIASNEAVRMAELISRLRATYRPVTKEEFETESLNNLVVEVQKLLSTHLRRSKISFVFAPDQSVPPVRLLRDQMKQVLLNIYLNAVESMPDGGQITVQVSHLPESQEVLLSITDTGPGIAPETLPYIFDPFFTTKESGTGLGLSITYDIIQHHNGHIEVQSEPGHGARFLVYLPTELPKPG
jgi:signal transduction histidine kinase